MEVVDSPPGKALTSRKEYERLTAAKTLRIVMNSNFETVITKMYDGILKIAEKRAQNGKHNTIIFFRYDKKTCEEHYDSEYKDDWDLSNPYWSRLKKKLVSDGFRVTLMNASTSSRHRNGFIYYEGVGRRLKLCWQKHSCSIL